MMKFIQLLVTLVLAISISEAQSPKNSSISFAPLFDVMLNLATPLPVITDDLGVNLGESRRSPQTTSFFTVSIIRHLFFKLIYNPSPFHLFSRTFHQWYGQRRIQWYNHRWSSHPNYIR